MRVGSIERWGCKWVEPFFYVNFIDMNPENKG